MVKWKKYLYRSNAYGLGHRNVNVCQCLHWQHSSILFINFAHQVLHCRSRSCTTERKFYIVGTSCCILDFGFHRTAIFRNEFWSESLNRMSHGAHAWQTWSLMMGCTSSMSRRNSEATSFRLILVGLDGAGNP